MSYLSPNHQNESNVGKYLATIAVVIGAFLIVGQLPMVVFYALVGSPSLDVVEVLQDHYGYNTTFVLLVFPLVAALIGLLIGIHYIHKWEILKVFTARKKIDFKRILFGFLAWFAICFVVFLSDFNEKVIWNFDLAKFSILFVLSFLMLPLQCAAEELFFRGYLMQWIGIQQGKPYHAILLSGIIFGLLHFSNPEMDVLGNAALIYYIWTGFFLAILAVLDDGLELPLGYHIANNMFAALIVTTDWQAFRTDALFVDTNAPVFTFQMMAVLLAGQALFLFVFYRVYKWKKATIEQS